MAATYQDELDARDDVIDYLGAIDPIPATFTDALTAATRRVRDHIEGQLRVPSRVLHLWNRCAHPDMRLSGDDTLWDAVTRSTRLQLLDDWEWVPLEALDLWLTNVLELVGIERGDAVDVHEGLELLRQQLRDRP